MDKEHKASIDGDQWAQCVRDHGWLWDAASARTATLILAHGAGAPMDSDWMNDMAARLAAHGVNVLRFEFPYMAQRRVDGGKRRPIRRETAGVLARGVRRGATSCRWAPGHRRQVHGRADGQFAGG
jgi:predicted alpha/beta-hydrolase family hydrolase